jgi:hypothetical protein
MSSKPPYRINKAALERKAKRCLKESDFWIDVDLCKIMYNLPEGLVGPSGIFHRTCLTTKLHLDGALEGSILTLHKGQKEWVIHSPDWKKTYRTTQNRGETIYIPPGHAHQVTTTKVESIAYGAIWTSSLELKASTALQNRFLSLSLSFSLLFI